MDGVWRGPATTRTAAGEHKVTQTERIGPMLAGSIKVMEGKAFNADGSVGFNAFAAISYDVGSRAFVLHSYAQGRVGDFALTPTANGYTATLEHGVWTEVGDRNVEGQTPQRFFEMRLSRIGDTQWPAGDGPGPN
jgi:hypothetical protein